MTYERTEMEMQEREFDFVCCDTVGCFKEASERVELVDENYEVYQNYSCEEHLTDWVSDYRRAFGSEPKSFHMEEQE